MLLELDDITVRYGRIEALHGLTLRVAEGEVVALIGANGAGKTTTMRAISGLNPLHSGKIRFNGQDISGALVRLTLPGGAKLFRRTGIDGVAHRFVRPSRSGTLVIQSDVCFGAHRVTVLRAGPAPRVRARFAG